MQMNEGGEGNNLLLMMNVKFRAAGHVSLIILTVELFYISKQM